MNTGICCILILGSLCTVGFVISIFIMTLIHNKRLQRIESDIDSINSGVKTNWKLLTELKPLISLTDKFDWLIKFQKTTINSFLNDSKAKDTDLIFAVNSICKGMNKMTYDVLDELINAVEIGDAGRLASVIRSAHHMCKQYELAEKSGANL